VDQWTIVSTKGASEQGMESDRESQYGGSGNGETTSDEGECVKIGAATAFAGISYDFGLLIVTRTHIGSLETYGRFFLKACDRPPSK
jgi:hypothetical protein